LATDGAPAGLKPRPHEAQGFSRLKPAEALCFARAAFQAEEVSLRNRQDHDHPHFFCVKVDFTLFAGFLCWLD